MARKVHRQSKTLGLAPGTPVHVGEETAGEVRIRVIDYDESHLQEREVAEPEQCLAFKEKPTVTWINVDGVHQVEVVAKMGELFDLHPLVVEDIPNTTQRPKVEDYDDYLYVTFKMLSFDDDRGELDVEQVSLILRPGIVISFQERQGDVFDPVRERIRAGKGRVRSAGADYLCYVLIDAVVDHYFVVCEKLSERIEILQEELVQDPAPEKLQELQRLKRDVLAARKSLWPMREVVAALTRGDIALMSEATGAYLRDVHDHTMQVVDTIETFRDGLSGMLDIYLSSVSNRMNEVMKVLTIIATIFIPLGFLAGVYGMNFENMPELHWRGGYYVALGIMATVAGGMLLYFRRKRWI